MKGRILHIQRIIDGFRRPAARALPLRTMSPASRFQPDVSFSPHACTDFLARTVTSFRIFHIHGWPGNRRGENKVGRVDAISYIYMIRLPLLVPASKQSEFITTVF